MISFSLTEEQEQLINAVKEFTEQEVKPAAAKYDKEMEPEKCIPWDLIEKGLEMQIGSLIIPEEYGGCGYTDLEVAMVAEELAYGDSGYAASILGNVHSSHAIVKYGTEEQKKKWLTYITSDKTNRLLLAGAFTEPNAGSDVMSPLPEGGIMTTAVLDGDEYVLNGTKCFITNGGIASLYLVWARTDTSKSAMQGGLSVFIVPADTKGFTIGKIEDKIGQRLSQQSELIFDNCRIPKENLLGKIGQGFEICGDLVCSNFMMVGSMSIGIARAAYDYAYEYAKTRVQGGCEIINHQAISHKLADMLIMIETGRNLVWKSAWTNANLRPNNILASMCKVFCSDVAMKATTEAVQIFGGYGCSREYPVEKLLRDAKITQIYESPNETHKNDILDMMRMFEAHPEMM